MNCVQENLLNNCEITENNSSVYEKSKSDFTTICYSSTIHSVAHINQIHSQLHVQTYK